MAATHDMRVEKLFSVKDYVCVITGGGSVLKNTLADANTDLVCRSGIGLMSAQALAANGKSAQTAISDGACN